MDKETRNAIERATQRCRKLLADDFAAQLAGTYDVMRDGAIAEKGGAHLSARQHLARAKMVAAMDHKRETGMKPAEVVEDYLRDAAFTALNRFVALKMLEARGLLQECISKGEQSSGYGEFCGMAKGVALLPDSAGYRLYIECLFDELSTEVKVLFDRRDPASVLWPRRATFEELLGVLNAPELAAVWREDETIGWVYQYFNSGDERRAMREASQAPRNSRDLAVRNQFFTPRYVVQFLTDNTLGRIWYEMRHGATVLRERCEYMVRRSQELFLSDPAGVPSTSWEAAALSGDFDAIPEGFHWGQAAAFAHGIRGYESERALGLGEDGGVLRRVRNGHDESGGGFAASAAELWLALFLEHRADRHGNGHGEEGARPYRDALCRALRAALVAQGERAASLDKLVLVPFRAKKDPRDLQVLDPACGSGHFLLYAFDLLQTIYEEAWEDGHSSNPPSEATGKTLRDDYEDLEALRRAIPGLILRHNLHGVDIDPRCAQIAQLALWMRAQRAYGEGKVARAERPLIRKSNIVVAEPIPADKAMVASFTATLYPPLLGSLVTALVDRMKLAGELGSLLAVEKELADVIESARTEYQKTRGQSGWLPGLGVGPRQAELDFSGTNEGFFRDADEKIRAALETFAASAGAVDGVRRRMFADDATQGIAFLEIGRQKFDVVLMNPPFGAGSLAAKKEFEKAYPRTKNDVYAAFVERGIGLLKARSRLGAITSRTGFFLSSFQKWREEILLKKAPPVVFADLGAGVLDSAMVETAAYCLEVVA